MVICILSVIDIVSYTQEFGQQKPETDAKLRIERARGHQGLELNNGFIVN